MTALLPQPTPASLIWLILAIVVGLTPIAPAQTTRPKPAVLVHYMPWFDADPAAKRWGWHWTMNAFNPAEKDAAGLPKIAAKAHPLIGPYHSADPDVIEYHLLLLRLAGVDGIVVDWYGRDAMFDYAPIHRTTGLLLDAVEKAGLQMAICYEDQVIPKAVEAGLIKTDGRVVHARGEIDWLAADWFNRPGYFKHGGRPLLLSFGGAGMNDVEWSAVLKEAPGRPIYLSEHRRRPVADGAFDWPSPKNGLATQVSFLNDAKAWPIGMAVAFPRFDDIYAEAKIRPSYGHIADQAGQTFRTTLDRAMASGLPLVQVCTWNDWGEGTQIEPSVEYGYRDLEVLQRSQVAGELAGPNPDDLRLPLRLFRLRQDAKQNPKTAKDDLDRIAKLLADRQPAAAREALETMER